MRILLTNDDGLHAPGIAALHDALADGHDGLGGPLGGPDTEVLPVAPLTVQSATSHGVTFHQPLMVSEQRINERMTGLAVDGRPADCVKVAIANLWPERFGEGARPDLVVSGMNAGANVGVNVIYSGTVAAAIEAAFLGVPAIAVSLHIGRGVTRYDVAARHARRAIEAVIAKGLPEPNECININIPVAEEDGPMPIIRVVPMNTHGLIDQYERRTSPSGDDYYWASGTGFEFHSTDAGTDVEALFEGFVTVTPLSYDLTDAPAMARWRDRLA
jgi:5'-nucleotidase